MEALKKTNAVDVLIAIILGLVFACASHHQAQTLSPILFTPDYGDTWFESDTPRNYDTMIARESPNWRSCVHPLFALIAYPLTFVIKKVFALEPAMAVKAVISFVAFLWMTLLFLLLRWIGCLRLDAFLLCILAAVSAASLFFFTIPESYPFGSLTIIMALIVVVWSQSQNLSTFWFLLANTATLSVTTSNWMAGLFATFVNFNLKKAFQIAVNAFALTTVLWSIEKAVFPTSKFFLEVSGEKKFFFDSDGGTSLNVLASFFYHTLIMPSINIVSKHNRPEWHGMLTQLSMPGSAGIYGFLAVILWTIILACGIWALFNHKEHLKLRIVLGLTLTSQLLFHTVYGSETFLYSLHFIVLLVPMVALSFLTKLRKLVFIMTCLLLPCVAVNNAGQFYKAQNFIVDQPPAVSNQKL
jgi:hypothetical protein